MEVEMKQTLKHSLAMLFLSFIIFFASICAGETGKTSGPANGALVVAGGGIKDNSIYQRFMELAGGPDAPLVVIPTASSDEYLQRENFDTRLIKRFKSFGFTNITILHTRSREEADSETFVEPITRARGVWFGGGRQWRLADSYLNTRTHRELENLLKRGGVIGGSSAGATIQGSYLARGDTKTNTIMMGDHELGLGFLKNSAIDQHILARNRQFDLFEIIRKLPHLLGIGIDEDTAIVVRGNRFEVIGNNYVAIYDSTFWSAEKNSITTLTPGTPKFYFLGKGMRYNLGKRCVIQPITIPLRTILREEGIDAVMQKYQELKNQTERYFVDRRALNAYGYMLLRAEKYKEAIEIFQLNVEQNPNSWEVYDSLGEAYMKSGNKKQAALNYIESLQLNSQNENALEMLKKLVE
jgi:cyanophycinase